MHLLTNDAHFECLFSYIKNLEERGVRQYVWRR